MTRTISWCPFCGTEFDHTPDVSDSRSASGFKCEACNEIFEISVTPYPLP